jgi:hypothetical protein
MRASMLHVISPDLTESVPSDEPEKSQNSPKPMIDQAVQI